MSMSNIDSAKLFFGIVLNRLQHAFPTAVYVSAQDFWSEFAKAAHNGTVTVRTIERSYKTVPISQIDEDQALQEQYTRQMLRWMAAEGFLLSDPVSAFPYDYVLSSKALAALNITLEKDRKTVGEMLATAAQKTGDAAQSELIARLVSRMFDYVQGLTP